MKPEEARAIANAVVLKKTIMPKYYKLIKEAAEKGIYFVNIGKAGVDVIDLLKEEGYDVRCTEDDGDCHSSRCTNYQVSWKE